jgi:hypothetical protein
MSEAFTASVTFVADALWSPRSQEFRGLTLFLQTTDTPRLDAVRRHLPEGLTYVEFCASQYWLHIWSTTYVYKTAVQLKAKLQHTGTWLAAALPPCRLCYRSTVLFCHLRLTALAFPQRKILRAFKTFYCSFFFTFWKWKLRKSSSVCSFSRHLRVFSQSSHGNVPT